MILMRVEVRVAKTAVAVSDQIPIRSSVRMGAVEALKGERGEFEVDHRGSDAEGIEKGWRKVEPRAVRQRNEVGR